MSVIDRFYEKFFNPGYVASAIDIKIRNNEKPTGGYVK